MKEFHRLLRRTPVGAVIKNNIRNIGWSDRQGIIVVLIKHMTFYEHHYGPFAENAKVPTQKNSLHSRDPQRLLQTLLCAQVLEHKSGGDELILKVQNLENRVKTVTDQHSVTQDLVKRDLERYKRDQTELQQAKDEAKKLRERVRDMEGKLVKRSEISFKNVQSVLSGAQKDLEIERLKNQLGVLQGHFDGHRATIGSQKGEIKRWKAANLKRDKEIELLKTEIELLKNRD